MPIEASTQPGRSGIGRGSAGFSSKPATRPSGAVAITPKRRAYSIGTWIAPIVTSARLRTWSSSIRP